MTKNGRPAGAKGSSRNPVEVRQNKVSASQQSSCNNASHSHSYLSFPAVGPINDNNGLSASTPLKVDARRIQQSHDEGASSASSYVRLGDEKSSDNTTFGLPASHSRAAGKLVTASAVCLVFMIIEVIAGILSNSLALMTDASHLLSDLCAFLISLFAIWVSNMKGTAVMSFGYHRAEILGALLSVMLIWVVTAWLLYEAGKRFVNPPIVNGRIMFITAVFGTGANLFMTHILKMHSHGIGQVHDHDDDDHDHSGGGCSSGGKKPSAGCGHSHNHSHNHPHSHGGGSEHQHTALAVDNVQEGEDAACEEEGPEGAHSTCGGAAGHHHKHADDDDHHQQLANPLASQSAGNTELTTKQRSMSQEYENMNLRAAYIHALGDLLQNVGVMIASAVIWWNPTLSIADPICTVLFSFFVLMTTGSIIWEALNVLMEGTPIGVDIHQLQVDLANVEGVVEVHDLHVWSLSVGKPALACHLVIANEDVARGTLRAATTLCQKKYNILHTTIQTDFSVNESCCDTSAHQKCCVGVSANSAMLTV